MAPAWGTVIMYRRKALEVSMETTFLEKHISREETAGALQNEAVATPLAWDL